MSLTSKVKEEMLIELFSNHPYLRPVNAEMELCARDGNLVYSEFFGIVRHALGRRFSQPTFDEIDWNYVANYYWADEEAEAARLTARAPGIE